MFFVDESSENQVRSTAGRPHVGHASPSKSTWPNPSGRTGVRSVHTPRRPVGRSRQPQHFTRRRVTARVRLTGGHRRATACDPDTSVGVVALGRRAVAQLTGAVATPAFQPAGRRQRAGVPMAVATATTPLVSAPHVTSSASYAGSSCVAQWPSTLLPSTSPAAPSARKCGSSRTTVTLRWPAQNVGRRRAARRRPVASWPWSLAPSTSRRPRRHGTRVNAVCGRCQHPLVSPRRRPASRGARGAVAQFAVGVVTQHFSLRSP